MNAKLHPSGWCICVSINRISVVSDWLHRNDIFDIIFYITSIHEIRRQDSTMLTDVLKNYSRFFLETGEYYFHSLRGGRLLLCPYLKSIALHFSNTSASYDFLENQNVWFVLTSICLIWGSCFIYLHIIVSNTIFTS